MESILDYREFKASRSRQRRVFLIKRLIQAGLIITVIYPVYVLLIEPVYDGVRKSGLAKKAVKAIRQLEVRTLSTIAGKPKHLGEGF